MDSDEAARHRLGTQVLWYQRERLACRLKLLAIAQLLLCCTYSVAPRSLPCVSFGVLCGCGVLLGFSAAQTCSRPQLLLHAALCVIVAGCAMLLLRVISRALPLIPARQPTSHRLVLSFGGLTAAILVIQLGALHVCAKLLCLPATWSPGADETQGMLLLHDREQELLDLDLAEAPALPLSELDEPQARDARARRD